MALPAGRATMVAGEEPVAFEVEREATVDEPVAAVATAAMAVNMAEAGWRRSRMGDGWEEMGTDVGHYTRCRIHHSRHHALRYMPPTCTF